MDKLKNMFKAGPKAEEPALSTDESRMTDDMPAKLETDNPSAVKGSGGVLDQIL